MFTMKNVPQKLAALGIAALLQLSFSFNADISEAAPMQALTAASAYSTSPLSSIAGMQQKLTSGIESMQTFITTITSTSPDDSTTSSQPNYHSDQLNQKDVTQ
jgi:Flp pilus assembly protein TadD